MMSVSSDDESVPFDETWRKNILDKYDFVTDETHNLEVGSIISSIVMKEGEHVDEDEERNELDSEEVSHSINITEPTTSKEPEQPRCTDCVEGLDEMRESISILLERYFWIHTYL